MIQNREIMIHIYLYQCIKIIKKTVRRHIIHQRDNLDIKIKKVEQFLIFY